MADTLYEQIFRPHATGEFGGMRYKVFTLDTGIVFASVYPAANLNPNLNITRSFADDEFNNAVEWCQEEVRNYVSKYGEFGRLHPIPPQKDKS